MKKNLSKEMILNKEFHIDFKGYNAVEVDQFLDQVMNDYLYFEDVIAQQKELLKKYEDALSQQKRVILEYEGKTRADALIPREVTQTDLLKRVSKLEEAVFNKE